MNIGRETEIIEFKKSTSELKEGIIAVSSILNKHGRGTLYFGVRDSGEVCGQEIGKDTLRHVSRAMAGGISPACWYEVNRRTTSDGKDFIEVEFSGNQSPYAAYGRYYQRFADEDRMIDDQELENLFRSRTRDYSLWEMDSSDASIDEVDEDLLKHTIKKGNEEGRLRYKYSDKTEVLSKLGLLVKGKTILNNAGNVLFSADRPVLLKLATYATDTRLTFTKLDHFEGNVFECISAGVTYIYNGISWNISFDGGAQRKEEPEIPREAIREIIINAFAHGCYFDNTAFEIAIFKNRVTIYSPGHFPRGYKPEDFAGRAEEPKMMNPKIVNVLFKGGEIESFGSGFKRTFLSCEKAGVEYSYESTKSGFRFTFFRKSEDSFGMSEITKARFLGEKNYVQELSKRWVTQDMSRTKKDVQEMSKTDMTVYETIKKNPYASAAEIASEIGKSTKTVYRAIKKLKDINYIQRIGSDYNGHWEIRSSDEE